jgi:hypothetical protein
MRGNENQHTGVGEGKPEPGCARLGSGVPTIFGRVAEPMRPKGSRRGLYAQATARTGPTGAQITRPNRYRFAAIAPASVQAVPGGVGSCSPFDAQTSEFKSGQSASNRKPNRVNRLLTALNQK